MKDNKYLIPVFIAAGAVLILVLILVIISRSPAESDESRPDSSFRQTEDEVTGSISPESETGSAEAAVPETDVDNPDKHPAETAGTTDAGSGHDASDAVSPGIPDTQDSGTSFHETTDAEPKTDGSKQQEGSETESSTTAGETESSETTASYRDTEVPDTTVPQTDADGPDAGETTGNDTETDAESISDESTRISAEDSTGHGIELPVIPIR